MRLTGLATGIGSLPFGDPDPALDLIFSSCPEIPFWPQLPRRGPAESMVAQYAERFPCLRFTGEGMVFNPADQDREMEPFYERLIDRDIDYFSISEGFAPGLWRFAERLGTVELSKARALKFHVTGPFTFAASFNGADGVPLLHDEIFMQAYTKGLVMKALWQARFLRRFGKPLIVFIDEPYLTCFGSAFTPITRESVLSVLEEFCSSLAAEDLLVGVHCCGNTDWSLFTAVKGLGIINFDAFDFLDRIILYASDLKGFLERGGALCWGIVPTQMGDKGRGLTADALLARIADGVSRLDGKGVAGSMARENLLVSPACGLGSQSESDARQAFSLLADLSAGLRRS